MDDDGIGRGLSENYKAQFESTHQSKGIGLTQSRLELDKILNDREDAIEIIDKTGSRWQAGRHHRDPDFFHPLRPLLFRKQDQQQTNREPVFKKLPPVAAVIFCKL